MYLQYIMWDAPNGGGIYRNVLHNLSTRNIYDIPSFEICVSSKKRGG